jgi:DNA repair exonuclease SbcCD ATPase subunit
MKLLRLSLTNFKGIRSFVLEPNGQDATIYGDNATGKSTLADAFFWLLFGKDSTGAADFSIKPLRNGEPVHNLETAAEGIFDLDGRTLVLKKVFQEKWTKKRGAAQAEFTGHTTDHYIDGVPVPEKDFKAAVAGIADEKIFKLLTDPGFFNDDKRLPWRERRKILLDACGGDLSDDEVLASDAMLAKLKEIVPGGRTIDQHKAVVKARQAAINGELDKIPVRIDELQRGLPDATTMINAADGKTLDLDALRKQRADKQAELSRIENGGEIAERTRTLRQAEADLIEMGAAARNKALDYAAKRRKEAEPLQAKIRELTALLSPPVTMTDRVERELADLRQRWHEANAREYEGGDTCPACGQALPPERIEAAVAAFNRQKAEDLERITAKGRDLKAYLDRTIAENEESKRKAAEAQVEIDNLTAQIKAIEDDIAAAHNAPRGPEYEAKEKEIAGIKAAIEELRAGGQQVTAALREEIANLNKQIADLEAAKAAQDQRQKDLARIEELGQQQKDLAREYERLENELYLTEEFTRRKVGLLESRINSKFQFARFRMYNTLINGGLEDCCETLYGGVPYSSGLNAGHRVIVGLDIIRTLAEHFGFSAPVWIDNAESITRLPDMPGQVISLVVSEADKVLRVEVAA